MDDDLLSIRQAVALLKVSRPTFNKIRKNQKLREVIIGKRARFRKSDLLKILHGGYELSAEAPLPPLRTLPKSRFEVFSDKTIQSIEIRPNVFDLRNIELLDPYGVLSLLTTIIAQGRDGTKIKLLVDDAIACKYLHSINFFDEVGRFCKALEYDRNALATVNYFNPETLLPIIPIRMKGSERPIAEKLNVLLKQQGFSNAVGQYISWILGELADNALTHSSQLQGDRTCYVLATRFISDSSNCVIVGIADTGVGIQNSLKAQSEYSKLSDAHALLEAFRPNVSSWAKEFGRGKGLTDVVKIAKGNNAYFIVASNGLAFLMDFRENSNPHIEKRVSISTAPGTRYGLVLIDNTFKPIPRGEADSFLKSEIKRLRL
jgi:anti-sigma regulatory factor (Ser/Thr protein kinase)